MHLKIEISSFCKKNISSFLDEENISSFLGEKNISNFLEEKNSVRMVEQNFIGNIFKI